MDLISYGNDDEEDNNTSDDSDNEAKSPNLKPMWQDESDSEDSNNESLKDGKNNIPLQPSNNQLMSASELFSSVGANPDFLKNNNSNIFEIDNKSSMRRPKPVPAVIEKLPTTNNILETQSKIPNFEDIKSMPKSSSKSTAQPKEQKNNKRPLQTEKNDKDKIAAKDRVKRQRESGQSGIGEDFKTWRSEEEMRIRQHYD